MQARIDAIQIITQEEKFFDPLESDKDFYLNTPKIVRRGDEIYVESDDDIDLELE